MTPWRDGPPGSMRRLLSLSTVPSLLVYGAVVVPWV
jgi:hypothetical protein